ncbi:MAG: hypothetical protein CMN28_09250 [Salinisphaeraceae bacterium]|nr:hypothetical protein [Salinisphaeraceae bacterium]
MIVTVPNDRLRQVLTIAGAPVWAAQGIYTRLTIERLPEAAGPQTGRAGAGEPPLHIGFIGESTVAGVGAHTQAGGLAGQTAQGLAGRLGRSVEWEAAGANGATFECALPVLLPRLTRPRYDVIVVALGVNDTVRLTSEPAFFRHARRLLEPLSARTRLLAVADVPPVGHFPALVRPLRQVMGWRALHLSTLLRAIVERLDNAVLLPGEFDVSNRALMATDGFHPSEAGYAIWGEQLANTIGEIIQV